MVNKSYSFVDKELLYALLYIYVLILCQINFFITPNFSNPIQHSKRGSVLTERLPFFQWANPHHQCSPGLEYLFILSTARLSTDGKLTFVHDILFPSVRDKEPECISEHIQNDFQGFLLLVSSRKSIMAGLNCSQ